MNYLLNGEPKAAKWTPEAGEVSDLRGVDIFDSHVGSVYIDSEMEVAYAPHEVTLLTRLVEVCKQVEALLAEEQSKLVSKLPTMPTEHAGTAVARKYADPKTNQQELTTWTTESEKRLLELEQLTSSDLETKKRELQVRKDQAENILKQLNQAVDAINPDSVAEIVRQIQVVAKDQRASDDTATVFGDIARIDGVASESWKRMWEASRQFSEKEAYKSVVFPNVGHDARCVLCNQPLDDEARKRLNSFEEFVKGALSSALADSKKNLDSLIAGLALVPEDKLLEAMLVAAGIPDLLQENLRAAKKVLEPILSIVKDLPNKDVSKTVVPPLPASVIEPLRELGQYIEGLNSQIETLTNKISPEDQEKNVKETNELRALKWAAQQAVAIAAEVSRLKTVAGYKIWIDETGTRAISLKAGELASDLITSAFVGRFNHELVALGAKNIQVEVKNTRTTGGKPQYRLALRGVGSGVKVSEILSEGEHRIVALAAFLADVTGKDASTPFIFDDPISSLDQAFEERTAARLGQLSHSRQVIVFTHRLSFMRLLEDSVTMEPEKFTLKVEPWGTGNPSQVSVGGNKPEKALNGLKNVRLLEAKRVHDASGYDAYYPLAKALCSDFRTLIESYVEFVLLNEVVLRYRASVQTYNRLGSLAKISKADCDLFDELMTKYSKFEHSQSDETPVVMPEPEEFVADFDRVLAWHSEFKKRN